MIGRRTALGLLCAPALAASIRTWGWDRRGAKFELDDGSGEIQWISSSSFRMVRRWVHSSPVPPMAPRPVEFTAADAGDHVLLITKYLVLKVFKATFRVRVNAVTDGRLLLEETNAPHNRPGSINYHFTLFAGEEIFGLGPRTDLTLSARGASIDTSRPFLISTAGYGQFFTAPGEYHFDFLRDYRLTVRHADRVDYNFYYGPEPKTILEEHKLVHPVRIAGSDRLAIPATSSLPRGTELLPGPRETASWDSLRATVRAAVHATLSGTLVPAFDLAPYERVEGLLRARARQLAAVMPLVKMDTAAEPLLAARRAALTPFLQTYVREAEDRGLPVLHPLPLQFPNDLEARKYSHQFMLGDELLVAPALSESERVAAYLPMGRWTDLMTNIEHRGRRVVELDAPAGSPALLAKNGSIVPFARPDGVMELHYFPNLGAEFFLFEPEAGDSSQLHAGPAADYLRLEIESRVGRVYEWVIHHRGPLRELLGKAEWRHDLGRNNLHVTMTAGAGEDRIVNLLPTEKAL